MRLEAKLTAIAYSVVDKGTKFEFFCYGDEASNLEKWLYKKVNIKLEEEKRSLNANGYLWLLLGQLQEKLRIPKEDIYRQYIYSCGAYEVVPIKDEAVSRFIESWQHNGLRLGMRYNEEQA